MSILLSKKPSKIVVPFWRQGIVIAFGELFLKSEGVKKILKRKLESNLSFFLKKENFDYKLLSFRDRIFIVLPPEEIKNALKIIKNVFGISWVAECLFFKKIDLKAFSDFISENYQNWIKENETFAIRLTLKIKGNREKIISQIAKDINRKVNLSRPKREIFVEIREDGWFLYFKKIKGSGGLPVGSSGKVLTLISGGIDSPVAAFLMTKRGAENVWLHFHSFPLVSRTSIEKVKELAKIFLNYQICLKIYFVPFHKAQMEVKTKIPAKYRVLVYRRLMFRIAERIAQKEKCRALVTGESLGQVASQTLPNMIITGEGIKIPILRPLISWDKEEIINLAKKLKTFSISIRHQEDCCTLFTPKHSTAEGNIEKIKKLEKKLEIKKMIKECLNKAENI